MKFKHPGFLLLLVPLIWVVAKAYLAALKGKYAGHISVPWKNLWQERPQTGRRISPRFWPAFFYALSCAFFIIALARPQTSFNKIKRNVEGIDIMIVLDLSASMRIEDFRDRNRMEVAKPIIRQFIDWRANDKIGFQVFSGEAVTLVPPTLDHAIILRAIEDAQIGDLKDGTAIGDALSTAVGRLKESKAKTRVIVLLTDGDSNVGSIDPLTAGELAKGFGIKIYSVAIGRDGRVAMPFVQKDFMGRQVKTYQYFDSSINPDIPRQISTMTGGKFYRVQDSAEDLKDAFAEIDRLEKSQIETTEQVRYEEKFMRFVWFGMALFLVGFLMQHWAMRVFP
ncbi:MAG: VWA domain-containing protein [Bdellovibrionota bacterium]